MKMSECFFSMPRFVHLCRKEMVENWKKLVLRLVMIYGVMTISFLWFCSCEYNGDPASSYWKDRLADPFFDFGASMFYVYWLAFGALSASLFMEGMKSKTGRTRLLLTPCTTFEKFFVRWVIYIPAFLVAYLILFRLADWTRLLVMKPFFPWAGQIAPVSFPAVLGFTVDISRRLEWLNLLMMLGGYFFMQSFFVLGSVLWPRRSFVKTFAALILLGLVVTMVVAWACGAFIPDDGSVPDSYFANWSEAGVKLLASFLLSCATLFNWALAYFRFRESEIINRW
ncbi:MAG: hypothetical protein IJ511_02665 [Bacteroides sp.]|nr:hypothetical protein [Bacteroides sp.]